MNFVEQKGKLIVTVDEDERETLNEWHRDYEAGPDEFEFHSDETMHDFFENFIYNSEWEWIFPEDNGDLTDAPMLGIHGEPERRYGYMSYALRSPLQDLMNTGECIFSGPN